MEFSNYHACLGNDCCGPNGIVFLKIINITSSFVAMNFQLGAIFIVLSLKFILFSPFIEEVTCIIELSGCNGHFGYPTKCSLCGKSHNVNRNCCWVLCPYNTCLLGKFNHHHGITLIYLSWLDWEMKGLPSICHLLGLDGVSSVSLISLLLISFHWVI